MSKPSRQRLGRKTVLRIIYSGLSLVILLAAGDGIVIARLKLPLPLLQPQVIRLPKPILAKPVSLAWPDFGQAAIGVSGYGVLATNGAQKPLPTASIAKLITALTVLKAKPLTVGSQGPTITLTQRDVDLYNTYEEEDGSVVLVTAGEQISEYQVLQGMLLPSANNLADSLALWAFGSLSAYQVYANQTLAGLGLTHTHVGSDASGFLPDTTSTASDLVRLGQIAYANPVIAGIVSQSSATLPVVGTVENVNWLLGTAGINGLKTGNSNQAGGVFLFSAAYQVPSGPKVTLIGAVMDATTLQRAMDSAVPLLTSSQKALSYPTTLGAGQAVGQYVVPWGSPVTAITTEAVQALAWQGQPLGKPVLTLDKFSVPQVSSALAGMVSFDNSNGTLSSSPVKLAQPITKPPLRWRLFHT